MGAVAAAWAGVAIAGASAAYGAKQNKDAQKANEAAGNLSREDYAERLRTAGKWAKELNEQYNEIVKDRPNLSWSSFVKEQLRAIDDPEARSVYVNAKEQDYEKLREFAGRASADNIENLIKNADVLSDGKFKEIVDTRNDLVLNTDAASRYQRTYELAAPVRTDASTVKYDDKGRLIEGQRADKQAFQIANEVQTQVEQEAKTDLRSLENDRLNAANSQTEKARDFSQFFDATGYAQSVEAQRQALTHGYQQIDEQRAFDLYKMFAGAASGITPTTPATVPTNPGDALISAGVKYGTDALATYAANKKASGTTSPKTNTGYGSTTGNAYDT